MSLNDFECLSKVLVKSYIKRMKIYFHTLKVFYFVVLWRKNILGVNMKNLKIYYFVEILLKIKNFYKKLIILYNTINIVIKII